MEKDKEGYKIEFASIELVAKSLAEPIGIGIGSAELKFIFNYLLEIKIFPQGKNAIAMCEIKVLEAKENKEMAFFKTLCVFRLPDFDDIFKLENGVYDIPTNLEITLKSVGFSTTRGIIYSELRGTYLSGITMPLIDIGNIVLNSRKKSSKDKDNLPS